MNILSFRVYFLNIYNLFAVITFFRSLKCYICRVIIKQVYYKKYVFFRHDTAVIIKNYTIEQIQFLNYLYLNAIINRNPKNDMPHDMLSETIPNFHNTKKRIAGFFAKVKEDPCGRAASAAEVNKYYN